MSLKNLHALVGALNPAEKRYVRQFATRNLNGETHNYLQLFDRFLAGNAAKSGKQTLTASASECNYLYRFLLKSLRAFHEESTVDIRIRELLINADVLFRKRLYALSEDEINRAEKMARTHERLTMLLDILLLRANILIEHQPRNVLHRLQLLIDETNRVLEQLGGLVFYRNTENYAFVLLRIRYHMRREEYQHELNGLTANPGFTEPASFSARQLFYNVKAIHAICRGDFTEAASAYNIMIESWDNEPERKREDVLLYKKLLANYLTVCHALSDFGKIPALLGKIKAIPCRSSEEEAEQFQNTCYHELLYRINTDRFDDFDTFVDHIRKGLQRYSTKINQARLLLYYYNIAVAWFLLGRWKECDEWLLQIIDQGKGDHRQDIQHTARLLRLPVYFEMGRHDLLEYEFINVERYLRHHKAWFAYEAAVVKNLKKILSSAGLRQEELYMRFKQQLQDVSDGKNSASLPGINELQLWTEHHLTGRPMRDLLRAANAAEQLKKQSRPIAS